MRVLKVQGAELAALMLNGDKIVENRQQLALGWWILYVGKDRQWRDAKWAKPFKKVLDTVPSDESLNEWYGHAVGMIYFSEYRSTEACHGYKWAPTFECCLALKSTFYAVAMNGERSVCGGGGKAPA